MKPKPPAKARNRRAVKARPRSAPPHGSAFLEFFYEQAGKPIMNEAQYLKLRHETIPSLRRQLAEAETNLAEMDRYHTAHQYALYAWMSGPNDKDQATDGA